METIILVNEIVKRISDGKIFTPIIPNPNLGYYKSLCELAKEDERAFEKYIEKNLVDLNPTRFVYLQK